jgi:hypothetical protein
MAIIQWAHGVRQPWELVTDRLWLRHRIDIKKLSLGNKVRAWMRAQL